MPARKTNDIDAWGRLWAAGPSPLPTNTSPIPVPTQLATQAVSKRLEAMERVRFEDWTRLYVRMKPVDR